MTIGWRASFRPRLVDRLVMVCSALLLVCFEPSLQARWLITSHALLDMRPLVARSLTMYLKTIAKSYRTEQAFCLSNNSDHYQASSIPANQSSAGCSRATTPSYCQDNREEDSRASQLVWTADTELKNPAKGLCCGRDPHRYDIILGSTNSNRPPHV